MIKLKNKLQKTYLTDYNLLTAQDLLQAQWSNLGYNLTEELHKIKC